MKRRTALATVMLSALLAQGCVMVGVAAAGAGSYYYAQGELMSSIDSPFEETWEATMAAVKDLRFNSVEEVHDNLNGKIQAKRYNEEKVQLKLARRSYNRTEVKIRVGMIGDKKKAHHILEQIRRNLSA